MRYASPARDLVLGFKHGDRTYAALPLVAGFTVRARIADGCGHACAGTSSLDPPFPTPFQSIGSDRARLGAPERDPGSCRPLATSPPNVLSRCSQPSCRRRNVSGAFTLRQNNEAWVSGQQILLIDDVMTTGATVEACAETLLDVGAAGVDALTLARVYPLKAMLGVE